MPNWCACRLKIPGNPNDVRDCLASMATPGSESEDQRLFDFERVIPLPPELREKLEAPSATDSDPWDLRAQMVRLWGTKWNAYSVTIERQPDDGGAVINFDTAWTPPEPVIVTLADSFPSLEFDFVYNDIQGPIAGRAWRAPGEAWATIEARYDDGFCLAAVRAKHWRWDPRTEEQPPTPEGSPAAAQERP
jgi:hypothetical protein